MFTDVTNALINRHLSTPSIRYDMNGLFHFYDTQFVSCHNELKDKNDMAN